MASENGIMGVFAVLEGMLLPTPKAWAKDTEDDRSRRRATARGWAVALADVTDEAVGAACVRYAQEPKPSGAWVKTWPQLDDVRRLAGSEASTVGVPALALGRLLDVVRTHYDRLPLAPGEPTPYRLATWHEEERARWTCVLAAGGLDVVRTGAAEARRVFLVSYEHLVSEDRARWDAPAAVRMRERAAMLRRRTPDPWHTRADATHAWREVVDLLAEHQHDPALPGDRDRFRLSDDPVDEAALSASLQAVGGFDRLRALELRDENGGETIGFAAARKAASEAYDIVRRREQGRSVDVRVRALLAAVGGRAAIEAADRPALIVHEGGDR